ncbi:MAG: transporter, partial [Rhodospirillales bacterium]|nr:transporter [Rhodospirillales bacterium]
MIQPLLFATLAAIGNALFVYGQRGANASANPF